MSGKYIHPDKLAADAVVPQCLDNQYVSDDVFAHLLKHRTNFDNPEVRKKRKQEIHTEFIRSLVYSSQVIVNRASMTNNDYLYEHYLPENTESFDAFCKLVRDGAVVPFLFDESSLADKPKYSERPNGKRAVQALLDETGGITCVRLAEDDETNHRAVREMAGRFWDGLTRLQRLDDGQRNAMACELFGQDSLASLQRQGGWNVFSDALDDLAAYAFKKRALTRTDVYRDYLLSEGGTDDAIALGHFRDPDKEHPFVLERKKLVDLIYNTNLPDRLKRHTFTPIGLPSRNALQDDPAAGAGTEKLEQFLDNPETRDFISRTFMANIQKAMTLPLLRDLTVADVVELRRLEEWEAFRDSQRKMLENPLECLELFEPFQNNFDAFQRKMSKWYNQKYERPRTEERYVSLVTWGVSIAGKLLVLGLGHDHPIFKEAVAFVPDMLPKTVKGYAAKLMVSVYDLGERRLDKERSYSLDLMRTAKEFTHEDVQNLIARFEGKNQRAQVDSGRRAADQGQQ